MTVQRDSRSHRRLLRSIDKASNKYRGLKEAGALSVASGAGKLVIAVSDTPHKGIGPSDAKRHYRNFLEEAAWLKADRSPRHQAVDVVEKAGKVAITRALKDKEVSDLIVIGHGTINAIAVDADRLLHWRDIAAFASHLKRGKIEQRMCGHLPLLPMSSLDGRAYGGKRQYSVPFGTFAVDDLRNVIAAPGIMIPDKVVDDSPFEPVFTMPTDPTAQIADFNRRFQKIPARRLP